MNDDLNYNWATKDASLCGENIRSFALSADGWDNATRDFPEYDPPHLELDKSYFEKMLREAVEEMLNEGQNRVISSIAENTTVEREEKRYKKRHRE